MAGWCPLSSAPARFPERGRGGGDPVEAMNADPANASRALDELLVLRAQGGEADAIGALFARWNSRLLAYAAAHVARRVEPGDLVQETWLAAIRSLPRLRDPAAFPALLFSTLRRKCADTIRRRRRAGTVVEVEAPAAAGPSEAEDAVASAVHRLDPGTRDLIHLRYTADLAVDEIAAVLNVPAGTVKSRLHAARAELRAMLQGQEPSERMMR
jgi:RNA polymerase sigma factor (sigma-70 family)